jgi:hypothetical protein
MERDSRGIFEYTIKLNSFSFVVELFTLRYIPGGTVCSKDVYEEKTKTVYFPLNLFFLYSLP